MDVWGAAAHEERPPGEPGGLSACSQSVLRQLGGRRDGCLCAKFANAVVPVAYQVAEMVTSAREATGATVAAMAEVRSVEPVVNMVTTEPRRRWPRQPNYLVAARSRSCEGIGG